MICGVVEGLVQCSVAAFGLAARSRSHRCSMGKYATDALKTLIDLDFDRSIAQLMAESIDFFGLLAASTLNTFQDVDGKLSQATPSFTSLVIFV